MFQFRNSLQGNQVIYNLFPKEEPFVPNPLNQENNQGVIASEYN